MTIPAELPPKGTKAGAPPPLLGALELVDPPGCRNSIKKMKIVLYQNMKTLNNWKKMKIIKLYQVIVI
ncbi:hypothetical protein PBK173_000070200 [Plasmodium berghei]|uniref:Uncharacterized protein n=1 Tax=Plasmodium berghei TaxID=5821 RepID=A0A0Y9UNH4_PLABE|nr:hypothetical protein PBK173_000070200 [Plasmodium berghei]